jgi:hypothetical protein
LYHLHVTLEFQELEHYPSQVFAIAFSSEQERRNWRLEFDRLVELLNDQLDLGWMTCISPSYKSYEQEVEDFGAQHWTPAEAIGWVRDWYQDSLSRAAKK